MSDLVILKLGGSIVTKKAEDAADVNEEHLARLAKETAAFLKKHPDTRLVVVHGAGPFGHVPAKRYRLAEGITEPWQIEGVSVTHQSMEGLNSRVAAALQQAGVPAVSFQPSAGGILSGGTLVSFPTEVVKKMLDNGLVPVGYGDVLVDNQTGFNILSGDHLAPYLARELGATRVILATDVDGVLDKDGNVVAEITPESDDALSDLSVRGTDVTGGMKRKIEELLALAGDGIDAHIVNGAKKGVVQEALGGSFDGGTRITCA